jgi:hypothetical protein
VKNVKFHGKSLFRREKSARSARKSFIFRKKAKIGLAFIFLWTTIDEDCRDGTATVFVHGTVPPQIG